MSIVTTKDPHVRMFITREAFFVKSLAVLVNGNLEGLQALIRAMFGCHSLVLGLGTEHLTVYLQPEEGRRIPAEDDLRTLFPLAGEIAYFHCEVPARATAIFAPSITVHFPEQLPVGLAVSLACEQYLSSIGWQVAWEDYPCAKDGVQVLVMRPQPGQSMPNMPDHRKLIEFLSSLPFRHVIYANNTSGQLQQLLRCL